MLFYFIVRLLRQQWHNAPLFLANHVTDILFVPAMATFALIVLRRIRNDSHLLIPTVYVIIQTVLVSLYFEWYLPNYPMNGHTYTADFFDVICYFSGAILYLFVQYRYFQNSRKRKPEPN